MAQLQEQQQKSFIPHIPTPTKLDVNSNIEQNWKKFQRQWRNYEIATRLDKEDSAYRCAVLLACVGEDAQEIYDGLQFQDDEDTQDIEVVLKKFEEFCVGTTHEVYESYKFHARNQEHSESIDTYVASLRKLSKSCNFQDVERMIRDRIVIGVRDHTVREKMLQHKQLTLQQALEICRAHEASKSQSQSIASGSTEESLLQRDAEESVVHRVREPPGWEKKGKKLAPGQCTRCGKGMHRSNGDCPARNVRCRKCNKFGHYAIVCRSVAVHSVEEGNGDCEAHLGTVIGSVTSGSDPWKISLDFEGQSHEFRLDTGADVSVIPQKMVPKMKRPLQKADKKLFGPGRVEIPVEGKFTATMVYKDKTSKQDVFVVTGLLEPLLGRPAILALQLIERVNTVSEVYEKDYKKKYPDLFEGLGRVHGMTYKICLKDGSRPYAVAAPRRLAMPLKEKVKEEIDNLEKQGVIRSINKPTDWCAPIVAVPKSNNKVRVCVDLTKLNDSVRRENFPMPSTDELLAQLSGATLFTKLDCNSGFHQIQLDAESQELTTFITPFGRYCYTRLPFGISSGPEIFQRFMSQLLSDHEGVISDIDDLLVFGKDKQDHDRHLDEVLSTLSAAGVTLNAAKCQFSKEKVTFLGNVVSKDGIAIDPEKLKAVQDFPRPENISDLRRLLGMVNHVSKFAGPTLSDDSKPLRDLLRKDTEWCWNDIQETAFQKVKQQLTEAPVLAHYSSDRKTVVSADASSYGLGAVLKQKQPDGHWKPVFYASRSMSQTEQRYAQVEREALAVTWCCEKFSDYITGLRDLTIETDHKPLLTLLKTKNLEDLPPRIQRFRMRLMKYQYKIEYTRGKNLVTADALSRAPIRQVEDKDKTSEEKDELFVQQVIQQLPATEKRLEQIRNECARDRVCQKLYRYVQEGWPISSPSDPELKVFWSVRAEITVQEGLLLYRSRLIIPEILRTDILGKLHTGHQGIVKCRALARESVWWPKLSVQIESMVQRCSICIKERAIPPEPLITTATPAFPWQKVGMDLFEMSGKQYLLVVDYYSRFVEVANLSATTASHVISRIKSIFARHGIPQVVISDNGPQFACKQFREFAERYEFSHVTSSPYYPQANGEAERAVRTVKSLLTKAEDPHLALLAYRSTPLEQGLSPAELLFGRKIRTVVPSAPSQLSREKETQMKWKNFRRKDSYKKQKQREHFDRAHRARPATALHPGQPVWVHPAQSPGTVIRSLPNRDYEVQTPCGPQRRNRRLLVPRDPNPEKPRPFPSLLHSGRPGDADAGSDLSSLPNATLSSPLPDSSPEVTSQTSPSASPRELQGSSPVPPLCSSPRTFPSLKTCPGTTACDDGAGVKVSRSGRPIRFPDKLNL